MSAAMVPTTAWPTTAIPTWAPADGVELLADLLGGLACGDQDSFGILYHEIGIAGINNRTVEPAEAGDDDGGDTGDEDARLDGLAVSERITSF